MFLGCRVGDLLGGGAVDEDHPQKGRRHEGSLNPKSQSPFHVIYSFPFGYPFVELLRL